MIQPQTYIIASDNSGASKLICIRVLRSSRAKLGDVVIAVVKEAFPNTAVKRSEIIRAVVVRTANKVRRDNGSHISFDKNAAVLINKDGNPIGSRIFGPVARELRELNFTKIISLAPEVI